MPKWIKVFLLIAIIITNFIYLAKTEEHNVNIEAYPILWKNDKEGASVYKSPSEYARLLTEPIRFYVSKQGLNTTGTSWEDAFTSLAQALNQVSPLYSYDIWVEEGIYIEDLNTLEIPETVHLYGGFKGTESTLEEWEFINYPTRLKGVAEDDFAIRNLGFMEGFHLEGIECSLGYPTAIIDNYGTMTKCLIYNNFSDGGLILKNEDNGMISNCWIFNNECSYPTTTILNAGVIKNSSIYRNIDQSAGERAGIINYGIVKNCLIYGNEGTGIFMRSGTVNNCTVFGNITRSSMDAGGIVIIEMGTVTNCIVWSNYKGSPEKGDVSITDPIDIKIQYSCYGDSPLENGNFDDDPMFMNVQLWDINNWDFRLKDGSPCIDAGDSDETFNDGCLPPGKGNDRNDMGAYGGPGNCGWPFVIGKKDLILYILGKMALSEDDLPLFDINKDGIVNIADFILLIKYCPNSTIPFLPS